MIYCQKIGNLRYDIPPEPAFSLNHMASCAPESASHDADEESIQEELETSACKFACTGGGWGSYRPAGEDNGPV
jgi:hypothetical protein